MKKHFFLVVLVPLLSVFCYVEWYTQQEVSHLLSKKWVSFVYSKNVDTSVPSRITSTSGIVDTWASYRISRLPYPWDRTYDTYIVLPKQGIVAPIIQPKKWVDYNFLIQEGIFDYLTDLRLWVSLFPNSSQLWLSGNSVILWHSSFFKNSDGKYNTIFLLLPLTNRGDEIWIFSKEKSWWYKRIVYTTLSSYETLDTDTSIMRKTKNHRLTLITCVPIGTSKKRWVVRASLKKE